MIQRSKFSLNVVVDGIVGGARDQEAKQEEAELEVGARAYLQGVTQTQTIQVSGDGDQPGDAVCW
eukprot:4898314-Karenia_brevis.AAC.1